MGIKVDIGSADSQGSTANTVLSSRANYYDAVITAFNKLTSEEELKGKAYDSAKSYAENIMVPLVRGVILFSESLGGKASELPTLYHSQVGEESLDEETLQKQIEAENTTISTQEAILNSLSDLKNIDSTYKSNVQEIISNATSKRDELQKKLDKLQSFASSTSGQFSDSESLQSLVFQGFEQVTGDFGKFDGTFKIEGQAPWANNINNEWKKRSEVIQNYQNVVDKVKNETELDENDIKAIADYGKRYPGKELPENVKDAVRKYVESKVNKNVDLSGLGEFLETVRDTSLEEIAKDTISKLSSKNPKLSEYFKYFTTTDKFGNINITYSADSKGYTDALFKANAVNLLKQLTTSEINIPIPGTNSSVGISAISSVFIGMDFLNNLQNENAGRAFAHTAVTTTVTALGVASLEAGAIAVATAIGTESAMAFAASVALGTTPVGWTIAAGVAVGYVVGYAYKNNFLGIKDMANDIGDGLNKGIKDVGNAIDSGIKSIQKVFGW
ncbi:T7SS effector LXG polymorphic toxin [Streptococcus oralis]|uniref:WXG superfamily LXG domain protein n=1 Tax=Streptococcus oralis SK610 TaxID=1095741 RepID=I0Q217_STROR|nr:T7SS effector LXG polymorphic toxin [Streptococcus oralis]EIC75319.1 WXG superfamily LXG domain protein [Streptococcus oralis SK610]